MPSTLPFFNRHGNEILNALRDHPRTDDEDDSDYNTTSSASDDDFDPDPEEDEANNPSLQNPEPDIMFPEANDDLLANEDGSFGPCSDSGSSTSSYHDDDPAPPRTPPPSPPSLGSYACPARLVIAINELPHALRNHRNKSFDSSYGTDSLYHSHP
jgi:hypothetical protein